MEVRNIRYVLGRALESMGKPEQALAQYQAVYSEDLGFRDVEARIHRLSSDRSFKALLRVSDASGWVRGVAKNCMHLLRSS